MIRMIEKDLSITLKQLYRDDEVAQRFFEWAAKRQRNPADTPVERAASNLGASKSEITDLFKKLDEIGVGTFKFGRRGFKSRIIWEYEVRSLGEAAQGISNLVRLDESVSEDVDEEEDEEEVGIFNNDLNEGGADESMITHAFQLRSDLVVNFELPKDLSNREAERLAGFIKSLPFE